MSMSSRIVVLTEGHTEPLAAVRFEVPDPLAPGGKLSLGGEMPSIINPPPGCAFHPRCRYANARCRVELPRVRPVGEARVACHRAEELEL